MISSSIGAYYDDTQLPDDSTVDDSEASDEVPVGLIVGCTIGSVALVAIIIIVVYKFKQRKDEEILPENSDVVKNKQEEIVVPTLT